MISSPLEISYSHGNIKEVFRNLISDSFGVEEARSKGVWAALENNSFEGFQQFFILSRKEAKKQANVLRIKNKA